MPLIGSGLIQAADTFVGAYDAIPSIAAAYSTRRLLTSYEGPLLRLVADRTGYPEQDIGYTAAGDLDTAAATSFLAGDTGYVTKWYDQAGSSRDLAQATLVNMPLYIATGQNNKPVLRGDGANQFAQNQHAFWDSVKNVMTVIVAAKITSDTNAEMLACGNGTTEAFDFLVGAGSVTGDVAWRHVTSVGKNITQSWHIMVGRCDGSFNDAWFDDVAGTQAVFSSVSGTMDRLTVFARRTGNSHYAGDISELVICSTALSTANREAAQTATNAYWSIY